MVPFAFAQCLHRPDQSACNWADLTARHVRNRTTPVPRFRPSKDIAASRCVARGYGVRPALDPHNAVVHYYTGVLRLAQAERALEWYDGGRKKMILVASRTDRQVARTPPLDVVPNSKSMYKFVALPSFGRAVWTAHALQRDQLLVPANGVAPENDTSCKACW